MVMCRAMKNWNKSVVISCGSLIALYFKMYLVRILSSTCPSKSYLWTIMWCEHPIVLLTIFMQAFHSKTSMDFIQQLMSEATTYGSILHVFIEETCRLILIYFRCVGENMEAWNFCTNFRLQMEKEKLFSELSQRLAVAMSVEEKAKLCLGNKAEISEFEDVLRFSSQLFYFLLFKYFVCYSRILLRT